ncbi:MAG: hypothetical protein ACLFO2_03360 [Candidatus Woesearchaeota archaeon]
MTDLGRQGYALKGKVNDFSGLERLFRQEAKEDKEASFLKGWLQHKKEFEEFFSFFSAELARVGGQPQQGYEAVAGHKEYDFREDLTWTSVMKHVMVETLRSNYDFRITAMTSADRHFPIQGVVGYDNKSLINTHKALYDVSMTPEDLRSKKPLSLIPKDPEPFRQVLRATIDSFMEQDRKNLSRDVFFEEFFDKNKAFTMEDLRESIEARGGNPDYFNEHLRLDQVLPQWVENGDVKEVDGQYHIVYENIK